MKLAGFFIDDPEYTFPLAFVELHNLKAEQKVDLLAKLDQLYGDTDQDTHDWALEYQVIARMMLHQNWMVVNPIKLAIAEAKEELMRSMGPEDGKLWEAALEMSNDDIWAQYCEAYHKD